MRPLVKKIGTCTTSTPQMQGVNAGTNFWDASDYRDVSIQLVDASQSPATWNAGSVAIQASLDGTTYFTLQTATAPGIYTLPAGVLGRISCVASGLPSNVSIDVWFGGRNTRTDY